MPDQYALQIAAVKLSKIFGWTLDYAREIVLDPFESAVVYGVLDGLNKASNKGRK